MYINQSAAPGWERLSFLPDWRRVSLAAGETHRIRVAEHALFICIDLDIAVASDERHWAWLASLLSDRTGLAESGCKGHFGTGSGHGVH